jgi:tetratricopeptide (TPR) repeat protein
MRVGLLLLIAAAAFAADANTAKDRDLCSPPPGSIAPSLPAHILTGQGTEYIHFTITTSNPEAQKFFTQGVAQMHSFWANEAERSFLQAAALDPSAPMPYWGIAMVAAGDYRPHFQLERDGVSSANSASKKALTGGPLRSVEAAKKALELSGNATPPEKLYIESIVARRTASDPDAAYIAGLRKIVAAYPDEVEAGTYLALHLMRGFTLPDRQPRTGSMEAAAILRDLAVRFPDHPGVHHYIIHGFEGATFARDAWPSCRRYPELVTNIPHALHMPGHIWAQTGQWDAAAKSFEDAAQNELAYMKADALYGKGHHGHNVQFLITTYVFQGKYQQALDQAKSLMAFGENPREKKEVDDPYAVYRQGWFATLRTLVAFAKWDEILDGKTLPVYDKPREQAWRHWAVALALGNKGSAMLAKKEQHSMDAALKDLAAKTGRPVPPVMEVAQKELDGQIALFEHKTDKGLKLLEAAAKMERSLRYTEPPSYPRPVLDVLGAKASAAGRSELAQSAFKDALDEYPADPRAVAGLKSLVK